MKVAIVGSRSFNFEIPQRCIPKGTTQIISGGAIGADKMARRFAIEHGIKIVEILPEYNLYGRCAPLKRNDIIVKLADLVVAFWDGKSRGTKYVIEKCKETATPVHVYRIGINGKPNLDCTIPKIEIHKEDD